MCIYYNTTMIVVNSATSVIQKRPKVDGFVTRSTTKTLNILLIGCGPHAKRVYLPALSSLRGRYDLCLKAVVEIANQRDVPREAANCLFQSVDLLFIPVFTDTYVGPPVLYKQRI